MEVSGQLHILAALSLGKEPPSTLWIGGWVSPGTGTHDMEKRKILTLPGLKLWTLGRLSRNQVYVEHLAVQVLNNIYTNVTFPVVLFKLWTLGRLSRSQVYVEHLAVQVLNNIYTNVTFPMVLFPISIWGLNREYPKIWVYSILC
jgi:hypothetical protein